MNLNDIRPGTPVVIDANIVLYAISRSSVQCERFLRWCSEGDVSGVLTTLQLGEISHRLMLAEARDNGWIEGPNPAVQLARKPERVRSLRRYAEAVKNLMAIGLRIEPVQKEDITTALFFQRGSGLMTNDSLLLAVAERLRIPTIVSADRALAFAEGFSIFSPDDLK